MNDFLRRFLAQAKPAATPDIWWWLDGCAVNDAMMRRLRDVAAIDDETVRIRGKTYAVKDFAP